MFSEWSPKDKVLCRYKSITALPHGLTALCPSKGGEQWNTSHAVSVQLSSLTSKWKNDDVEDLKAKSFPFRKFPASVCQIDLWVKHALLCTIYSARSNCPEENTICLWQMQKNILYGLSFKNSYAFCMYYCKKTGDFIRS